MVRAKKILTQTSKNLKVPDVTVNVARFLNILTREVSFTDGSKYDIPKGVINYNTDFTVYNFIVALFLNNA